MFFESWEHLTKVVVVGTLAYLGLVTILRFAGNRLLAQMSAVDLIGTVALGSILANVVITPEIPLVDGLMGFILLIGLQLLVAFLILKFKKFRKVVHATPRLLFHNGQFIDNVLIEESVTKEEILHAVREKGFISLEQVGAIVLEINGMFSIMPYHKTDSENAFDNVRKD